MRKGAWFNKGYSLGKLGKYEEAIEYFDKAIQIDPNNASAFYNDFIKGDIASGLVDLGKALELDKENYLELAKQDKDFESIRNDERFKALIKNYVEERGNKNIKCYTSDGKPVSIGKQK